MKRFYLMLCFLMSIIGSAWGQETVTKTFVVEPTDETVQGIVQNGISNEHVSISFSGIEYIASSKEYKDEKDNALPCFKFNDKGDDKLTISRKDGVTITNVTLRGIDAVRDMKVNGEQKGCEDGSIRGNWTITGTPGDGGTVYFEYYSGNAYIYTITVEYTYTTDYNTNANASVLQIGSGSATATNANIFTYKSCDIDIDGQLINNGENQSYVTLNVIPSVSGTYSFTSMIATAIADRYVTFSCEDEDGNAVTVENETKNITSKSWTGGDNYTWTAVLESGKTYVIKLLTGYTNQNGNQYTVNIFDMNIGKMVYPWTVSGNTLTIVSRDGEKVPGGISTVDDGMNDISGLNVTLTGDASYQWEIWGNAYGKQNPTTENNIPTSGTYVVLEPTQSGKVTIVTNAYADHTYKLVNAAGEIVKMYSASGAYNFEADLEAGVKYYYYVEGKENLGFSSITYEQAQETTTFNVSDFRYAGASSSKGQNLD